MLEKPKAHAAEIKQMYRQMYNLLIEADDRADEESSLYSNTSQATQDEATAEKMGPYFKKFATVRTVFIAV